MPDSHRRMQFFHHCRPTKTLTRSTMTRPTDPTHAGIGLSSLICGSLTTYMVLSIALAFYIFPYFVCIEIVTIFAVGLVSHQRP